jgi:hypothetical protein
MIRERAHALASEHRHEVLVKKCKVLSMLIQCQEKLDEIMLDETTIEPPVRNVGDINVSIDNGRGRGGNSGPSKVPFQPFDGGDLAAELKKELRKSVV